MIISIFPSRPSVIEVHCIFSSSKRGVLGCMVAWHVILRDGLVHTIHSECVFKSFRFGFMVANPINFFSTSHKQCSQNVTICVNSRVMIDLVIIQAYSSLSRMALTAATLSSAVCFLSVLEPTLISLWILTTPFSCSNECAWPITRITSSHGPSAFL